MFIMAEFLGNKGLYRLLENSEYDYVAFVMTKWHVHSFEAALMMLQDKENRRLKGIVIIKAHPVNGFLLDENSFSIDNTELYYSEEDEGVKDIIYSELCGLTYYLKLKKSARSSFYFLRPTSFRYPILGMVNKALHSNKKISFVKLDEGVGTYIYDSNYWFKNSLTENPGLIAKLKCYVKHFEEKLFKEDKLRDLDQYIDACLFNVQNGTCFANEGLSHYYQESIRISALKNQKLGFDEKERYIIINTQIPHEIFKTGKDLSGEILKKCIDIFSENGYKVYVKTHPRDRGYSYYESLGAEVINENITQEAMLALVKVKPVFIVGFFSTTLVTSNVIFGVKTISLDDIVDSKNEFLDKLNDSIIRFKSFFGAYICFCEDYMELEHIIGNSE